MMPLHVFVLCQFDYDVTKIEKQHECKRTLHANIRPINRILTTYWVVRISPASTIVKSINPNIISTFEKGTMMRLKRAKAVQLNRKQRAREMLLSGQ